MSVTTCPHCHRDLDPAEDSTYCEHCGENIMRSPAPPPAHHHVCPVCGAHAPPGRSGRLFCDGKRIGTAALEPGPDRPHLPTRCEPREPEASE